MSTSELIREVQSLAKLASLTIDCPSFGNYNAELAIVGEYPGEAELTHKMPFFGTSGRLLFDVLGKQGLTRQHVWTTNVVRRRVVTGSGEKTPVNKAELEQWSGILNAELMQLPNLKYILILGNLALEAITGETGINNWRGSVINWQLRNGVGQSKNVTLIAANNPAYVLRQPENELMFLFDLNKLKRVREGKYKQYQINAIINPSPNEAIRFIDRMHSEGMPVAFDIETISNETACVGLANDPHVGMCINFRDRTNNRWSVEEEREVRKALQSLFADENVRFVAQNGSFDTSWLWYKDRIRVHRVWFDTLLAHHTLYPSLPHSLGFLTAQYTEHPYYKDEKTNWREGGNIDTFWEYNVKDCCITTAVQRATLGELQAQKLDKFFFDHVMRLQPHLVSMTVGGILCDTNLKEHITEELTKSVNELERTFNNCVLIATEDPSLIINPRSPKQLSNLFFNKLRLVGRGTSTNEDNRKRMLAHRNTSDAAKDVILALNRYSEENKFLSTYAKMTVDEDGRIRCEYKQFGTTRAPGRLSSASSPWGSGMNLQNQPDRAKPMFIADDGYRFLYFDLSQAEARIVAYYWRVHGLIVNFEAAKHDKSLDVHRANASRIFKCNYNDVPSFDRWDEKTTNDPSLYGKPTLRFLGKRCVHGLNYRMGPDRLAETCGIPIRQALEAYHAYHRAFPEIQQAWEETTRTVYKTRELWSLMGRRLKFLARLPTPGANEGTEEAKILESIIAFVPQSTIGDKVSKVIYDCHEDPEWPTEHARIVLNIHDALIALVPDDDEEAMRIARIMHKYATAPILIHGTPVSIPADFAWSIPDDNGKHRWSTLKKFKLEAA